MIKPGLVSITFRELTPRALIDLTVEAGLQGLEWGGDVHVPPGEFQTAQEVARMCQDVGLGVYSYGSYYQLGQSRGEGPDFAVVLETARNLGTDMIRVWAGRVGSAQADSVHRDQIVSEAREIADLSAKAGVDISFEFHGDTLTDTAESALRLVEEVGRDNVFTYWQPPLNADFKEKKRSLCTILPHLSNVHVFHWTSDQESLLRWPLQDGIQQWREYIDIIKTTGREHALMLEYVKDDSPMQFLQDAETLKRNLIT